MNKDVSNMNKDVSHMNKAVTATSDSVTAAPVTLIMLISENVGVVSGGPGEGCVE